MDPTASDDVASCLAALGGLATRAALVAATSRRSVDAALRSGAVESVANGRYALPAVGGAARTAHALSGILSLGSAALHHGWEVKTVPSVPHVTVPRRRRVTARQRSSVVLHRYDLLPEDITDGIATGVELTLLQCGRQLPFDEALAVFDSAARHGVPPAVLRRAGLVARGPGSAQVRRLASVVDGRAANPFESVLRAIALDVPGLDVVPQLRVRTATAGPRPDLVDERLQIVLEADSFAWHGDRAALRDDARRYDLLTAAGWRVLRFAWEDVMFDQTFVRRVLMDLVAVVVAQTQGCRCDCHAA